MTVLVLGATGTIGREVVAGLIAAGTPVRAFTRDSAAAHRLLPAVVEIVEGDLTSTADLTHALDGVSGVICTHGGDSNPERVYYGGVRALVAALAAAGRTGEVPVALMSSINVTRGSGAYANLMNWKRRGERLLRASGVPLTVIRPGWFGQSHSDEQRPALHQGDTIEYGSVATAHVAEALIAALANPGYTAELFSEPGSPPRDWAAAYAALTPDEPRGLDGPHDPADLPEDSEPAGVRADLARVRQPG